MLSIAIKNALLVTLIILILHFMIKNHLLERFTPMPSQLSQPSPQLPVSSGMVGAAPSAGIASSFTDISNMQSEPAPTALTASTPITTAQPKVDKEAELYNFIFNDDAPSCAQPPKETPYIPEPATIQAAKAPMKQSLNNDQMFVSEYDNESALNGGMLFGGLKGFDMQERAFMAYEPAGCSL